MRTVIAPIRPWATTSVSASLAADQLAPESESLCLRTTSSPAITTTPESEATSL